jgi:transcriptional accessory protein Tex/SPT6
MPAPRSVTEKLETLLFTDFFTLLKEKPLSEQAILHFACGRVATGVSKAVREHFGKPSFPLDGALS